MHANRPRSGFTILEAAVALAIIGMVCVGVLGAYGTGLRADASAAAKLPLVAIAEERLAAVDLQAGSLDALPDSIARGTVATPYGDVTYTTTTRIVARIEGLYDITVKVARGNDSFVLATRRYRHRVSSSS